MIGILKFIADKLDFVKLAEALRKKNNREGAAKLHLLLVTSYDVIELYEIIIDELHEALLSQTIPKDGPPKFFLNPSRIAGLLAQQSENVMIIARLLNELLNEASILDRNFVKTYRAIFPGKFSILWSAHHLLTQARLPLSLDGPGIYPANKEGEYRTLWFTHDAPEGDRAEAEKYLHGYSGIEKKVIDINNNDGDIFFKELEAHFKENNPKEQIAELRDITEKFKEALLANFSLEDILTDIGRVSRHSNWATSHKKSVENWKPRS